jgi:hypothetical protein
MLKTLQHIVQVPQVRSFAGDITEPIGRTYQVMAYDESRSEANSKATPRRHSETGNQETFPSVADGAAVSPDPMSLGLIRDRPEPAAPF